MQTEPSAATQNSIQQSFARIRLRFMARLQTQIDKLDDLMVALEMAPDNPAPLGAAREIVHTIVGVAATLGFPKLGDLATEAERSLVVANEKSPDPGKLANAMAAVESMVVEMDDIYRVGISRDQV